LEREPCGQSLKGAANPAIALWLQSKRPVRREETAKLSDNDMSVASPHPLVLATFLGGWEVLLILAVFVILLGAKKVPEIMRGFGNGMSEFSKCIKELVGRQANDAGKSVGGIFGKPAAEALTHDNQTAEFHDPAVLRRGCGERPVRQYFRDLWRNILKWLRTKH
jgi:sec-independent protein translocase protein TatA